MPDHNKNDRGMRRIFWFCWAALCLIVSGSSWAETVLVAPRPVVWKHFLGVNAHLLWFAPQQDTRQLQMLRALGLHWVRVDLHWDRLEPEQQQYQLQALDTVVNLLQAQQMKSVFYLVGSAPFATSAPFFLPYTDQYPPEYDRQFARRMALLAGRYPSVSAWQIWNEPNLPAFWRPWGNAQAYGELLQDSVRAIRQVSPDKTVVMAGMAYYSQMPMHKRLMLEQLGASGAFGLGAVVAYHPYSQFPEGDEPAAQDFILRGNLLNQRLRAAGVGRIWATEWGWSSYAGPREEQPVIGRAGQADFVLRRLALMSAMDYDRIFLFALSDLDSRATIRDRSYGLLDLNGQPKSVYRALARFLAATGPMLIPAHEPVVQNPPADLYSIGWKKPDGSHVWMFWAANPVTVTLSGIGQAMLIDPVRDEQHRLQSATGSRLLLVPVKQQLQLLAWH